MNIVKFEFSLFGINTYAVFDPDTKDCAVIDPGMSSPEEREAVREFIVSNGLHLTHIINTHLHIDHAIGNSWLKAAFPDAEVYANDADAPLGERLLQQAQMFGLPINVDSVKNFHHIRQGDKIHIGNGTLEVIHVPGHSPGGVALYDKADGFLISGDSLFAGSIGRTDLPGGSMSDLVSHVKDRLLTLPPSTVVYPGHGEPTTIGHEAKTNPFLIY